MRIVIVGNAGCRRVAGFQEALRTQKLSPATLVSYQELIRRQRCFSHQLQPDDWVRIECATEDLDCRKAIAELGYEAAVAEGRSVLSSKQIERLVTSRGPLIPPRQLHLGFLTVLRVLDAGLCLSGANPINSPANIALSFDKVECQQAFARAGVSVPEFFPSPSTYEELKALTGGQGHFMLKLAHGAGAAGCLALNFSSGRVSAITTVVLESLENVVLANCSKRPIHLMDETQIAAIANWICGEKAQLERWLPKARIGGSSFDLRLLVLRGRVCHAVVRCSKSVFTNLNLGNQRGDWDRLKERLPSSTRSSITEACESIGRCLSGSLYSGVDLLVTPQHQVHVLEANAFGDFLPNIQHQGEGTYAAELSELLGQRSQSGPSCEQLKKDDKEPQCQST
jgi:hypothetical protein